MEEWCCQSFQSTLQPLDRDTAPGDAGTCPSPRLFGIDVQSEQASKHCGQVSPPGDNEKMGFFIFSRR